MSTALFWASTQRIVVDGTYRLYRKSVRNYYCSLRNSPEERRSQLLSGGSLKSRTNKENYVRKALRWRFVFGHQGQ